MRQANAAAQVHPSVETLALFTTGDLPFTSRISVGRHVRRCSNCENQVSVFRSARSELRREASEETLTSFEAIADWNRLEREMLGNIAVGVDAARCVDKVRHGNVYLRRAAFVTALIAVFVAGFATHFPPQHSNDLAAWIHRFFAGEQQDVSGTVVRTTQNGIAVRSQGATLTILHPPSALVTVSGSSAVEARYVDEDTGQVTITNVYGQ